MTMKNIEEEIYNKKILEKKKIFFIYKIVILGIMFSLLFKYIEI